MPVIKRAETMDFAAFHAAYEALVEKARSNKLMPDDFAGATMTLTNPGGLGTVGLGAAAHGRPGQHHRGRRDRLSGRVLRPCPRSGSASSAISKVMTVTSTYDHRVIQGAESGAFLRDRWTTCSRATRGSTSWSRRASQLSRRELPSW